MNSTFFFPNVNMTKTYLQTQACLYLTNFFYAILELWGQTLREAIYIIAGLSQQCCLHPCHSKCGQESRGSPSTWELGRNAESQVPPRPRESESAYVLGE